MKKLVLLLYLCLVASVSFAQTASTNGTYYLHVVKGANGMDSLYRMNTKTGETWMIIYSVVNNKDGKSYPGDPYWVKIAESIKEVNK